MHHSMHSGSSAREAIMPPQSNGSQPKLRITPSTCRLAAASFPQRNIVGGPCSYFGCIMRAAPTLLKALTTCASGAAAWTRSPSDSFRPVVNTSTPSTGGASAIGLVVSITVLPARLAGRASAMASSAARPSVVKTTSSPNCAVCSKVPARAPESCPTHCRTSGLLGSREPSITVWPCSRKPAPSTLPTFPEPKIPIFIVSPHRGAGFPACNADILVGACQRYNPTFGCRRCSVLHLFEFFSRCEDFVILVERAFQRALVSLVCFLRASAPPVQSSGRLVAASLLCGAANPGCRRLSGGALPLSKRPSVPWFSTTKMPQSLPQIRNPNRSPSVRRILLLRRGELGPNGFFFFLKHEDVSEGLA